MYLTIMTFKMRRVINDNYEGNGRQDKNKKRETIEKLIQIIKYRKMNSNQG